LGEHAAGYRMLHLGARVDAISTADAAASDSSQQFKKGVRLFERPLQSVFIIHDVSLELLRYISATRSPISDVVTRDLAVQICFEQGQDFGLMLMRSRRSGSATRIHSSGRAAPYGGPVPHGVTPVATRKSDGPAIRPPHQHMTPSRRSPNRRETSAPAPVGRENLNSAYAADLLACYVTQCIDRSSRAWRHSTRTIGTGSEDERRKISARRHAKLALLAFALDLPNRRLKQWQALNLCVFSLMSEPKGILGNLTKKHPVQCVLA
jgi:hypothetical protein